MGEDSSEEVKEIIKKYSKEDIEFLKPLDYLSKRNSLSEENIKEEIIKCDKLAYTEKQDKPSGTRYAMFFKYSNKRGRCYVLEFKDKLSVVTIYPIGRRTLKRYVRKRFIK